MTTLLRQCRHELKDLVRVSKVKGPARKRLKSTGIHSVGLWREALTTLDALFAAPLLSAARLFGAPLRVSKSKLICIVKGFLPMGKHSKEPFSLHLSMILKHKTLDS